MQAGPGYRVAYPKEEWLRADAWAHLHGQQIPGCPKVALASEGEVITWAHGWRKAHTATEWGYVYRGARSFQGWAL